MTTAEHLSHGMPPTPLGGSGRQSSGYYVARYLRRLIFEGVLRPGRRIPQEEVAKVLGVSRVPVREAIIALEAEGFVRTELHRGAFVSSLDEQEVRDHYELYGILQGFAAERALERADDSFLPALRDIEHRLSATEDPAEVGELAFSFHRAIVTAARSPRIRVVFQSLPGLRPSDFFGVVPGAMTVEKRGVKAVLRALERGDTEEAAAGYAETMRHVGDKVVDLLRDRGLFSDAPAASSSRVGAE